MPTTQACLTAGQLEAVASGTAETAWAEHADRCTRCQTELTHIQRTSKFLVDLVAAVTESEEPKTGGHSSRWHGSSDEPGSIAAPWRSLSVPGYELTEEMARGGQGVVYNAIQTATRRRVAVKMLREGALASPRQRFRFEREVDLLASLHHPGIVTVFDRGVTGNGLDFVAMELVKGVPLDQHVREAIDRGAPRDRRAARDRIRAKLALFEKIASAVQHAHSLGVIHRDLKPGNILVDEKGEPRVIDFGLARGLGIPGGPIPTLTEEFMGTRLYASPEQLAGESSTLTTATDVYSLGVILYEAMTGRSPYPQNTSPAELERHIAYTPPVAPSKIRPEIPADVETIMLRALSKDPERRYASAGSLAGDLRDVLADRPISARRDSTWYVLSKYARRRKGQLAALVGAAFVLTAGIGVAGYGMAQAGIARVRGEERTRIERQRGEAEAQRADTTAQMFYQLVPPPEVSGDGSASAWQFTFHGVNLLRSSIDVGYSGDPALHAAYQQVLASTLLHARAFGQAEDTARRALMLARHLYGDNHYSIAEANTTLARIVYARGRTREAENCARTAIAVLDAIGGGPVDARLAANECLALALTTSDPREADRIAADNLALARKTHGQNNVWAASSLAVRARASDELEQPSEAARQLAESLRTWLAAVGDEHPDLPPVLEQIADHLRADGATDGLEPIMSATGSADATEAADRLLAISTGLRRIGPGNMVIAYTDALAGMISLRRALLPDDRDALARSYAVRGSMFRFLDRLTREHAQDGVDSLGAAIEILEQAPTGREVILADCLEQQKYLLGFMGKPEACRAILARCAAIWDGMPPALRDEVRRADVHRQLAAAQANAGDHARAEATLREALAIFERECGPESYICAVTRGRMAWSIMQLGRSDEAESLIRQASIAFDDAAMPGDQRVELHRWYGGIMLRRGYFEEAECHLLDALDDRGGPHGLRQYAADQSADLIAVLEELAQTYDGLDEPDLAARWRQHWRDAVTAAAASRR